MPYYQSLELYAPPNNDGKLPDLPSLPDGIGPQLAEAGLTINHGLLVGELLGVKTTDTMRLLEDINRIPDSLPTVLLGEDIRDLYETFSQISIALHESIDSEGCSKGIGGTVLEGSELVEADQEGRLYLQSRHLELLELKFRLAELSRFFQVAIDHNLLIEIV